MTRFKKIEREARDAVIAARFRDGPEPVNPWRKNTTSRIRWDMAARITEQQAAEILQVGA